MICITTSHCVQNEVALGRTRSKWTTERPSARGDDGLDWDGSGAGIICGFMLYTAATQFATWLPLLLHPFHYTALVIASALTFVSNTILLLAPP